MQISLDNNVQTQLCRIYNYQQKDHMKNNIYNSKGNLHNSQRTNKRKITQGLICQ